ncbi:methyltransferase domain-containing protein [Nesterenkonia sp. F]|uniref:methyltransferase domain-containing protein n=1 Tax=Nesterenkonia sp. F TaxID=795955 RepID=UPI0002DB9AFE|nr:methyltransferase domain-containing protein [Nesterenkonia sp. F]
MTGEISEAAGADPWPVRCPHCGRALRVDRRPPDQHVGNDAGQHAGQHAGRPTTIRALSCDGGHRFDAARQGYVNLLVGRGSSATPDDTAMIMARERVQDAGILRSVTEALTAIAARTTAPRQVLDCGAGTGHHLHALLEALPAASGIALDLSPAGLKRAAKHPRTLALAWDLWRPLPVADASIDLLVDVFAPRSPAEYARVLSPGGRAVVVTPRPGHLHELAAHGLLGMREGKHRELLARMGEALGDPEEHRRIGETIDLDAEQAADLIMMGPAGHHRHRDQVLHDVGREGTRRATVDVDVTTWRRHAGD